MLSRMLPVVNSEYSTNNGEFFTVIGTGTQGVVVEYADGRVALIPNQDWGLQPIVHSSNKQH